MSSNISQRYSDRDSFDIREEKLLAMGKEVRRETGNDVFSTDPQLQEWMQRVKKLGGGTSSDPSETDDDRARRLEEEIAAQRKARKERREERKRSLSPLKDSPRSIASGPRSPTHSILSKEPRDSSEASPITPTITPITTPNSRRFEREESPSRGKDESRIDRDKVGEMLLGKNAEFFRQKEKPLGLVKSNDGDGGLHGTGAMPLPGMRQTKDKTFLTMISQQDIPSASTQDSTEGNSPYNAVSRFNASHSTPSLSSQIKDEPLERTESAPTKDPSSPSKPVMPWMMPSSTRGAGGFVASAALKRSSTLIKSPPPPEAEVRTRPVTMYGRPMGHQRDFAGSVSSTRSASPLKSEFSRQEKSIPLSTSSTAISKSISTISLEDTKPISSDNETVEEAIPIPPQHKSLPTQASPPTSPPVRSAHSPSSLQTTPRGFERSPTPPSITTTTTTTEPPSRKRWSPTKSSWLDSALQKADTPGSPPKRTSSIRPIAPAVPAPIGNIPKSNSTSRMSALGGMGGRRDVAGITPQTSSSSGIESRLAALEKKTPPRSTSFRDNLKSASPTPSPPGTKPTWQPKADPAREKLLAARSGLAKTPAKRRDFSDPLKDGILAARQNLKVQDKTREKKEDELKMSILNARKGLKRAGSREEESVGGERRSVTPTVMEETQEAKPVKVEMKGEPVKEMFVAKESKPVRPSHVDESVRSTPQVKQSPMVSLSKPAEPGSTKAQLSPSPAPTKPATKPATSPKPQKAMIEPSTPIRKSIAKHKEGENDSPTPQKKFPKPEETTPEMATKPASPKPSPTQPVKQTPLPITSETKTPSFKESIVNRFNPGLASILSKGPPTMSVRPLPVKSASAPEPSRPIEASNDPQQLTHLTKGRARGPKKRNSVKRTVIITEPEVKSETLSIEKEIKDADRPRSSQSTTSLKRHVIKEEPDSPPPPISSIWPKPPRPKVITTSLSPDKLSAPTFPSSPDTANSSNNSAPAARSRQRSISPVGSMKQRLAELSPLRRDRQNSTTRSLFGNLLRSPSAPAKPKYPQIEIIPASLQTKIVDKERLFVQAWSIVSRVKHVSLPNSEEHILYENDMHAFLYMFNEEAGASEPSAIKFLWVGRECKLPEKEGMEFVRLMGDQNADTQVIRQGQETPLFVRALGSVIVTRSGTRRKLDCLENALYCVRGFLGGISIDEVPFEKNEFCSGFSYVVKKDGDVFVWHGNGSLSEEIAAARRFAGLISSQVKETMESDPGGCAQVWKCFDDSTYASGNFWRRKYDFNGFNPTLYLVEGLKARQMSQFHMEHISPVGATIVDGGFVVYVVVPPVSSRSKNDVGSFLQFARDLADRSDSVAYVVHGKSHPPHDLKAMFRQWQLNNWPIKAAGLNLLNVDAAFDVLERERFSIKELQGESLPLGVDPEKLEYFLSDEEFELVMGMSKAKYESLPGKHKDEVRESGLGLLRELRI